MIAGERERADEYAEAVIVAHDAGHMMLADTSPGVRDKRHYCARPECDVSVFQLVGIVYLTEGAQTACPGSKREAPE